MTDSEYQIAFYDFIKNETGNGLLNSVAGSGKSYTIHQAVYRFLTSLRILVTAFNKDIIVDFQARTPSLGFNVEIPTINSLGNKAVYKKFGRTELDVFKTSNILQLFVSKEAHSACWYQVKQLISLFKSYNLRPENCIEQLDFFLNRFDIEIPSGKKMKGINFEETLVQVFRKCNQVTDIIDFDDQIYFPLLYDLPLPQYHTVFVDEAQDLNVSKRLLLERCVGSRFIAVGDRNQAIYGFAGADPTSMDAIKQHFNCKELSLSVCYRCPKLIVAEAKKIVPQIEPWDQAPEGTINNYQYEELAGIVNPNDFVLCRKTAPLVSHCLEMIRSGKKAMVKGKEIGKQLGFIVDNMEDGNLQISLDRYFDSEREKLSKRRNSDPLIQNLQDRVMTVQCFIDQVGESGTKSEIKSKIDQIFDDKRKDNFIIYMTKHKAKGLQAKTTHLLACGPVKVTQDWQDEQESNLEYVGITRSQDTMNYIAPNPKEK